MDIFSIVISFNLKHNRTIFGLFYRFVQIKTIILYETDIFNMFNITLLFHRDYFTWLNSFYKIIQSYNGLFTYTHCSFLFQNFLKIKKAQLNII